jgi:hypothetical protein
MVNGEWDARFWILDGGYRVVCGYTESHGVIKTLRNSVKEVWYTVLKGVRKNSVILCEKLRNTVS